jgi:uncharacterized protein (TIGR04222 family)
VDVASRRIEGSPTIRVGDSSVDIAAASIRRDGWIEAHLRFPRGAVVATAPLWQQRQERQRASLPTWISVAGSALVIGLVLLIVLRQGYDAPPPRTAAEWASLIPPDPLSPVLAGALVSNGSPQFHHGMAALLALADRGVVEIREEPKGAFGARSFTVARTEAGRRTHLAPHEEALLAIIFRKSDESGSVSLGKARTLLVHHFSGFGKAVDGELRNEGLLDPGRRAHRSRYTIVGLLLIGLALAGLVLCLVMMNEAGPFPLFVPLALAIVAIASFIFGAGETPLSNEGIRRADAWRAYRKHLRHPQEIEPRWGATPAAEARLLPFVVAFGLADAWSKFMKKRRMPAPAWFHAASDLEASPAFAAFLATGGSGAHGSGGAGGGGGGAAGGGGSGAG